MSNPIWRLERRKSILIALAELEVALHTYHSDDEGYKALIELYEQLKTYKEHFLDYR